MDPQFQNNLQNYWDKFVDGYSDLHQNPAVMGLTLLNMLKIESADSILDAGCGPGLLLPYMLMKKKKEATLVSVDLSKNITIAAAARVAKYLTDSKGSIDDLKDYQDPLAYAKLFETVNWRIQQADVEVLSDFKDEQFDRYYSNMVLHLTGNPEAALKEAYRVLKKGGIMVFAVWGRKEYSDQFTLIGESLTEAGYVVPKKHDSFKFGQDKKQVEQLLTSIGFKDQLLWYQNVGYDRFTLKDQLQLIHPGLQESYATDPEKMNRFQEILQAKIEKKLKQDKEPFFSDNLLVVAFK